MADYLPPVVTKLTGDIDDFLAKLAEAEAALDEFADHVKDIPIKFDIDEASIAKVEAVANALGDALHPEINVQMNIDTMNVLEQVTRRVSNAENDAAKNAYLLAMANRMEANSARDAAAANTANNNTLWGWGVLTRDIQLWGGMLGRSNFPGVVRGWHLALDAVFESAIALGGALIALGAGVAAVTPAAEDIYNHMIAVHEVSVALGQTIPPLTGWFEQLQHAVAPQTLELFGGALNLINGQAGTLTPIIREVVTGMDNWIARLDMYITTQGHVSGVLQAGVGFLRQFTSFADDLGVALGNLIKADPGTAHFLMDLIDGFGKAIEIISKLPTPILYSALAIHSFLLWGGLLTQWATNIGTALFSGIQGMARFAAGLGLMGDAGKAALIPLDDLRGAEAGAALESDSLAVKLRALAFNPFTWVVAAIGGLAYLAFEMSQITPQASSFISNLNQQISSDNPSQAILDIGSSFKSLNQQIQLTVPQIDGAFKPFNNALQEAGHGFQEELHGIPGLTTSFLNWSKGIDGGTKALVGLGKAAIDFFPNLIMSTQAANSVAAYRGEIVKLTGQQDNLFHETGLLLKQGYTYNQSLAIMSLAGVQAGDSFALMKQKVSNLITGYQAMSIQGGMLANSVDAVTFATEQQNSKVSALTQGWSAFFSMLTGGETGFTTFEQQLTGMATAASGSAASISISNGKVSVSTTGAGNAAKATAKAMNDLSTSGLQLRQSFTTAITDAGQLQNSLITMASAAGLGAKGTDMLARAGKDMVAQLLPMAQGSQYATAMLYGLAQQAGYQGVDSFKALATWVGNTKNPMQDLNSIVNTLTTDSANLAQDVKNLADAINQNLNQAMSAAIFQASGGQQAFDNFATAAMKAHGNMDQMKASGVQLASELISVTGSTSTAQGEFDTFMTTMGYTKAQADTLWQQVVTLASAMNNIPNVSRTITISTNYINSSPPPGFYPTPSGKYPGFATGGLVPGYGGGDKYPALLEGGEAVVPKHLVYGVAPYLGAHNVPGFAEGGYAGDSFPGVAPGEAGQTVVYVYLDGKQIQKTVQKKTYKDNRRNGLKTTGKMSPN